MAGPLKLVIFDCDGVLVDSERLAVRVEAEYLTELGWPLSQAEIVERFTGQTDQYMDEAIEAQLGDRLPPDWKEQFQRRYRAQLGAWDERLAGLFADGRRAVVWGAGSKGVAFLCALPAAERIEVAVDINPYKHGMFMASTGQRIVPPAFLADYRPDVVIVMNPIYLDEIRAELDRVGVDAEVVAV